MKLTSIVDVSGLLESLGPASAELKVEAIAQTGEAAERIAERARQLVKRSADPHVHEEEASRGDRPVHEAISVARDGEEWAINIDSDHALELEFGTSRMGAQPYLRPAIDEEARGR